ncbi:MAG: hypothetical protein EZS28_035151, partial [Streblomastix strix]
MGHLLALTGD